MEVKKLTGGPRYCRTCRGSCFSRTPPFFRADRAVPLPLLPLPLRRVQTSSRPSLPPVQALRPQDGPPLFVLSAHPPSRPSLILSFAGPWVNNCVGHYNYGHFCRFLFFVDVTCAFHLWMVTKRAFGSWAFFVRHSPLFPSLSRSHALLRRSNHPPRKWSS